VHVGLITPEMGRKSRAPQAHRTPRTVEAELEILCRLASPARERAQAVAFDSAVAKYTSIVISPLTRYPAMSVFFWTWKGTREETG